MSVATTVKDERLYQVLLRPVVTEKANNAADNHNQAVFFVLPDATKSEVKRAVEKLFDVKVASVQLANLRGKIKRVGRYQSKKTGDRKKAVVRLQKGHDIDSMSLLGIDTV